MLKKCRYCRQQPETKAGKDRSTSSSYIRTEAPSPYIDIHQSSSGDVSCGLYRDLPMELSFPHRITKHYSLHYEAEKLPGFTLPPCIHPPTPASQSTQALFDKILGSACWGYAFANNPWELCLVAKGNISKGCRFPTGRESIHCLSC